MQTREGVWESEGVCVNPGAAASVYRTFEFSQTHSSVCIRLCEHDKRFRQWERENEENVSIFHELLPGQFNEMMLPVELTQFLLFLVNFVLLDGIKG